MQNQLLREQVYVRHEEGTTVQTTQVHEYYDYEEQQEEYDEYVDSPQFALYEIMFHAIKRQMMKPFQILKSYILFDDDDSSIEVGYKHGRGDMEIIVQNISSTCELYKKKQIITGFIAIKHFYEKKIKYESVYLNRENMRYLTSTITMLQHSYLKLLQWEGFGGIYQFCKGQKLSNIVVSKIEFENEPSDFYSKDIEDIRPFLNYKHTGIQDVNSFLEEGQFSDHDVQYEGDREAKRKHYYEYTKKEEVKDVYIEEQRKYEKKNNYKGYEIDPNGRLVSDKSVNNTTPHNKSQVHFEKQIDVDHKEIVTKKKQGEYHDGHTYQIEDQKPIEPPQAAPSEVQQIYLIRDFSKKKGPPSNYIKIPLSSDNVKIIELQTQKKKKKKGDKKKKVQQILHSEEIDCQNCKFCQIARERKQFMMHVNQRLSVLQLRQDVSTQNYEINEFNEDHSGHLSDRSGKYNNGTSMEHKFKHVQIKGGHHKNIRIEDVQGFSVEPEGIRSKQILADGAGQASKGYSAIDSLSYERKTNKNSDRVIENSYYDNEKRKISRAGYGSDSYDLEVNNLYLESRQNLRNKGEVKRISINQEGEAGQKYEVSSKQITGGFIQVNVPLHSLKVDSSSTSTAQHTNLNPNHTKFSANYHVSSGGNQSGSHQVNSHSYQVSSNHQNILKGEHPDKIQGFQQRSHQVISHGPGGANSYQVANQVSGGITSHKVTKTYVQNYSQGHGHQGSLQQNSHQDMGRLQGTKISQKVISGQMQGDGLKIQHISSAGYEGDMHQGDNSNGYLISRKVSHEVSSGGKYGRISQNIASGGHVSEYQGGIISEKVITGGYEGGKRVSQQVSSGGFQGGRIVSHQTSLGGHEGSTGGYQVSTTSKRVIVNEKGTTNTKASQGGNFQNGMRIHIREEMEGGGHGQGGMRYNQVSESGQQMGSNGYQIGSIGQAQTYQMSSQNGPSYRMMSNGQKILSSGQQVASNSHQNSSERVYRTAGQTKVQGGGAGDTYSYSRTVEYESK